MKCSVWQKNKNNFDSPKNFYFEFIDNFLIFDITEEDSKYLQVHKVGKDLLKYIPHPGITCSKLTIETLEQGVKYVQS